MLFSHVELEVGLLRIDEVGRFVGTSIDRQKYQYISACSACY